MTEQEWLTATDMSPMLEFLSGKASDRKLRLLTCAFCSHTREVTTDPFFHTAFDTAERHADGLATNAELGLLRERIVRFAPLPSSIDNAMVLPNYLLSQDEDLAYAVWGSGNSFWSLPASFRSRVGTLHVAYTHDIFGNPFRPVSADPRWLTSNVVDLAAAIYKDHAFDRLAILSDALQDAGCDDDQILAHCRSDGPHVRGCWVVDLLLGKE